MQAQKDPDLTRQSEELMKARDCLHLMLLEYGDVRIETLGQLLRLTNTAELEYSQICNRRRGR